MRTHILVPLFVLAVCAVAFNAVGGEPARPKATMTAPDGLYTCPMHPQIRWSKPDDCPICGMKLAKPNGSNSAANGHNDMQMDSDGMGAMGGCGMCMQMMEMGGMKHTSAQATRKAAPSSSRGGRGCGC